MLTLALQAMLVGWAPGAAVFRLPIADRDKRAALEAGERLFWSIVISLAISLSIVLALAAMHSYTFNRLLAADAALAAFALVAARFRISLGGAAPRPGLALLLPLTLVALGGWRFFPPAEYVVGGKDPGTYMNEGIQIAQRGTLVYADPVVAAVPAFARDLFFPSHQRPEYYSVRFMGFWIRDPEAGTVVGQFPHVFPASIAIGYGLYGLTGARATVGVWAIFGLLAVFFAARRVTGPAAAFAACVLLALHVVEVWFARYPNAEVVMQTLLFAALLAAARAHVDDDRFFGPVAAGLLGLLLFLRFDAVLGIAGAVAGLVAGALHGRRLRMSFVVVLAAASALAAWYLLGPMRGYAELPIVFLSNLRPSHYGSIAAAACAMLAGLAIGRRYPALAHRTAGAIPLALTATMVAAAVYALYFRHPGGKLAAHDAYALRTFAYQYATIPAVVAALMGFAIAARRAFWRAPGLFTTFAVFCLFLFYKIRIVPEHFWMSRRFLPVILPGVLVFACAAALAGLRRTGRSRWLSAAIGVTFIVLLALHYERLARPVMPHVELAGVIPQLETLAARIRNDELLLVESRDAGSDAHVMALPLAYIYARNVLVLAAARPDTATFAQFLDWARSRYGRVYFLGGGGTELLSRYWTAASVASQRFQVPEYESSKTYPRGVRRKEFDFGLYELLPPLPDEAARVLDLDVGIDDDLNVVRFHAKEQTEGRTIRWSQRQSFVSFPVLPAGSREVVIVMSAGGRPPAAPPADVEVYLDEQLLGTVHVEDGFAPYTFAIPADVAAAAARSGQVARLRLVTAAWNPHEVIGSPDDRELGVMVDRVQVR
ncbi:MAG: hypothetical protein ACRD1U_00450 [Vicinamibacterales bacterium]